MAETIASVVDFSKQGIDLPNVQAESIASAFKPVSPEFIGFYNQLVSLIAQCQIAFEKDNYERMTHYVVAVNDAIRKYFSSYELETSNSDLDKIAEDALKKAKNVRKNTESFEDFKQDIFDIVSDFREKILNKVKQLTFSAKPQQKETSASKTVDLKTSLGKPNNKAEEINEISKRKIGYAFSASIDVINSKLKIQEKIYNKAIAGFALNLGSTILSNFNYLISKLTYGNLAEFQKKMNMLNKQYDKVFDDYAKTFRKRSFSIKNTVFKLTKVRLKVNAKTITNFTLKSLTGFLYLFFGGRFLLKMGFKAIGTIVSKGLSAVRTILGFSWKILSVPLKAVGFLAKTALKIVSFGVKTVKNFVGSVFSTSKKLYKKIVSINLASIVGTAFTAFFSTYAGAYFLGYTLGRIWRSVLKLAGVSDEDISKGNYTLKDSIIKPFLEKIEEKFLRVKSFFVDYFSSKYDQGNEYYKKAKKKITEKFHKTRIYKWFNWIKQQDWKKTWDDIIIGIITAQILFTDHIIPAVKSIWSLASAFVGNVLEEPKLFARAYTGTKFGVMAALNSWKPVSQIAKVAQFIGRSGGITALVAGAITLGVGALLTTFTVEDEGKNLKPTSKFQTLYKDGYQTNASRVEAVLEKFTNKLSEMKPSAAKERFDGEVKQLEMAYVDILTEEANLQDYKTSLLAFADIYKKAENKGYKTTLIGTDLANSIIYRNGVSVIGQKFSNFRDIPSQIAVLSQVLNERITDIEDRKNSIEELAANADANDISSVLRKINERKLYVPDIFEATVDYDAMAEGGVNLSMDIGVSNAKARSFSSDISKEEKEQIKEEEHRKSAWNTGLTLDIKLPGESTYKQENFSSQSKSLEKKRKKVAKQNANILQLISVQNYYQDEYGNYTNLQMSPKTKSFFAYLKKNFPDLTVSYGIVTRSNNGQFVYQQKQIKINSISEKEFRTLLENNSFVKNLMQQTFDNDEFLKRYAADTDKNYAKDLEYSNLFANFLNRNVRIRGILKHLEEILKLFGQNFIQKFSDIITSKNLNEVLDGTFINKFQNGLMQNIRSNYIETIENANDVDVLISKISSQENLITTAQEIFNTSLEKTFSLIDTINENQRNALDNIKEDFLRENGEFRQQQNDIARQYLDDKQLWETLTTTISEILASKGIEDKLK